MTLANQAVCLPIEWSLIRPPAAFACMSLHCSFIFQNYIQMYDSPLGLILTKPFHHEIHLGLLVNDVTVLTMVLSLAIFTHQQPHQWPLN